MITRLQFGLKNSVLRIMFAACGTGISLKLSTSPSARCFGSTLVNYLPTRMSFVWMGKQHISINALVVCTFIIRNEIYRKSKVIAEQNIPFVSKPIDIHVRNGSNRSSASKTKHWYLWVQFFAQRNIEVSQYGKTRTSNSSLHVTWLTWILVFLLPLHIPSWYSLYRRFRKAKKIHMEST